MSFVTKQLEGTAGKDDDAELCFEQSLDLVKAVVEEGHPEAAYSLGAFAAFCK